MAAEFTGQSSEVLKTSELLPPNNFKPTELGDRRPPPPHNALFLTPLLFVFVCFTRFNTL